MADEIDTTEQPSSTTTETTTTVDATAESTGDATDDVSLMGASGVDKDKGDDTGETSKTDGDEAEKDKQPEGAPETYELTAPEGLELNDDVLSEVTPVFKELNLTNDQANKLMPLAKGFADRLIQGQADSFKAMTADWAKQTKADPELGGNNWAETESLVAKALDRFGAAEGSDFRKLLDETGLGNHPEMIRMFRKIGAEISEENRFPRGDSGAAVKRSPEEILYPSMAQAKE